MSHRSRILSLSLGVAAIVLSGACGKAHHAEAPATEAAAAPAAEAAATTAPAEPAAAMSQMPAPAEPGAVAELQAKPGTTMSGTVTLAEANGMVTIEAHLTGVTAGPHGFHIHETGDCGDAEFKNAGGHFNPTGAPHGAPTATEHHAGDLGNIEIGADGHGVLQISSSMLTLATGPNSAIGRAVIVHEKADDLKTQPTGDAGGRIACGVVKAAGIAPAPAAPATGI